MLVLSPSSPEWAADDVMPIEQSPYPEESAPLSITAEGNKGMAGQTGEQSYGSGTLPNKWDKFRPIQAKKSLDHHDGSSLLGTRVTVVMARPVSFMGLANEPFDSKVVDCGTQQHHQAAW